MSSWLRVIGTAIALGGCVADAPPQRAANGGPRADTSAAAPPSAQLVDTTIAPAVAGEAGWDYQQSADTDLAGDSQPERIVLTARASNWSAVAPPGTTDSRGRSTSRHPAGHAPMSMRSDSSSGP